MLQTLRMWRKGHIAITLLTLCCPESGSPRSVTSLGMEECRLPLPGIWGVYWGYRSSDRRLVGLAMSSTKL